MCRNTRCNNNYNNNINNCKNYSYTIPDVIISSKSEGLIPTYINTIIIINKQ